jgi:hypothetical protein
MGETNAKESGGATAGRHTRRAGSTGTPGSGGRISDLPHLLAALQFAAYKHRNQRRKDVAASPYINHPIEVATILATRGGVTDGSGSRSSTRPRARPRPS